MIYPRTLSSIALSVGKSRVAAFQKALHIDWQRAEQHGEAVLPQS